MIRLLVGFSVALLLFAFIAAPSAVAQKKAALPQEDAQALSLEVVALQTLNRLDLTMAQLEALLRLTKGAASTPRSASTMKVSPAFVRTLKSLRNALLEEDEERIDELKEKLGDIMDKDKIQLDDRVPISDPARRSATQRSEEHTSELRHRH